MSLTKVSAGVLKIDDLYGFRNRIINGDMRIDQRNNGAAATLTTGSTGVNYVMDRFGGNVTGTGGTFTVQRDTVAPSGFTNSLKVTVTATKTSLDSVNQHLILQRIEGFNVADLDFGTANAQPVTVSFWTRSSVTGTFGGSLRNTTTESYPFGYTINSADTWEYKTITIPGRTVGTWNKDNTIGMTLTFSLGTGSDRLGTTNVWASANYTSVPGAVNLMATNGATFYITGVQLEKGTVDTPFERRPYGTELALCERYFQRISGFVCGTGSQTTACGASVMYKTEMRGNPTASLTAPLQVTRFGNADFTQSSASVEIAGDGARVTTLGISLNFGNFTGLQQDTAMPSIINGGILTLSSEL